MTVPTTVPSTVELTATEVNDSQIHSGYVEYGRDIDTRLFAIRLPPPPLDALPYDVRTPLYNGPDVDVKRRWLWIPDGETIQVLGEGDSSQVIVPAGSMWWKEFYLTTDRGVFLIERRITLKTETGNIRADNGWLYYSAYYLPEQIASQDVLNISSVDEIARGFQFNADDWLPTQRRETMLQVQFEDVRGENYRYVFPGTTQCAVCHGGASGAYPNPDQNSMRVFGLHPTNLTSTSFDALIERGWIEDGALEPTAQDIEISHTGELSTDELTNLVVAQFRNNCATCHNASTDSEASFTGFVIDPNYAYTTDELVEVLSQNGIMMGQETYPIVSPSNPDTSEIMLRLHGENGRRRMPPIEGGAPELYTDLINLMETWILRLPG